MVRKLLSVLLMAAGLYAQSGGNLVKNGGFEELDAKGYPFWWTVKPEVFSASAVNVFEGKRSFMQYNDKEDRYQFVTQQLPAVPGKTYEFSVLAKMVLDTDAGETAKTKGQPNVFVEYYGQDGYIGGDYSPKIESLNTDWVRLSGRTRIPENATRVYVGLRAEPAGVAGVRVWFDDCQVHEYFRAPLTGILTTDCYRNEAAGGDVTVLCGQNGQLPDDVLKTVELNISDAAGKTVLTRKPTAIAADRLVYRFDASALTAGKYRMSCQVKNPGDGKTYTANQQFTRLEKTPNYKCYVDRHRRMVVDGKPFFPLGMYFSGVNPDKLQAYVNSKFNCLMPYSPPRDKKILDFLYEHHLKVFYSIKDYVSAKGDAEATQAKQRQGLEILKAMKDHPAIAVWYINDELNETYVKDAEQYRQACEELDPSRPTWSVLYRADQFHAFTNATDIHGCDCYPIPSGSPSSTYDFAAAINKAVMESKMVIMVPQAFSWGRYWLRIYPLQKCIDSRPPTFEEMDAMSWMSIAGGANGLIYYSYHDIVLRDQPQGGLPRIPFDEYFGECCKVAERVSQHERVLLSVEQPEAFTVKDNGKNTVFRAYGLDGETWILAVNTANKAESTFQLEMARPMTLTGTTLSQPVVTVDGTAVSATLQPLQAVFLRLK